MLKVEPNELTGTRVENRTGFLAPRNFESLLGITKQVPSPGSGPQKQQEDHDLPEQQRS